MGVWDLDVSLEPTSIRFYCFLLIGLTGKQKVALTVNLTSNDLLILVA